jgi:uncharacterized repeat protein (TIGR01451 family)
MAARWGWLVLASAVLLSHEPLDVPDRPAEPPDPPVPVVAIRVRVPAVATAGQELEYHLCVENCSNAAAHHVLVRNPLPANARFVRARPEPSVREPELRWDLGTLQGWARCDILLVLAPTGAGDLQDCARVQFEHGQCVTTKISRPALSLRKSGPTQAVLYDVLSYRLDVTNSGTAPVTQVVVTDQLPEGLEHSGGKNPLTWDLGTLEPGQSRRVEYQVVAKATGRLCNKATATAAGGLRDQAESCVTVGEAKLTLAKTGPERQYVNLAAAYQISVSNPGTAPVANVTIADPLPEGMEFVSASRAGRREGNEVRWAIGTLGPGEQRTVDVVLRVRSPGRVCNRATAAADRGLSARAEACTEFAGISALLLELVDTDDPVAVGAETTYVVTARNPGSTQVTGVRVVATVPEHLAVTQVRGPAEHRREGTKVVYEPLTLAAGASARYEIRARALSPGDVRFKVDLTADQLTGGPVHAEESTTLYRDVPSR